MIVGCVCPFTIKKGSNIINLIIIIIIEFYLTNLPLLFSFKIITFLTLCDSKRQDIYIFGNTTR